ncbi:hypothetical protein J5J86_04540 [Aquabacter sp. L1I39]|uniref:hypothetical protein n=1 Tax=Aquabacter sp. L1I39 TaxID=2820278 RepID=UPI001ADB6916|nr:hypothetical protein [Aquabacter sp. L1I39]QTL04608.1 hypothetical protein J5J86_04540 [Aquabacter sp. L1I39]
MSRRAADVLLPRRSLGTVGPAACSGARTGRVAQSWRDWVMFSVAYGIIVAAIIFTGPH